MLQRMICVLAECVTGCVTGVEVRMQAKVRGRRVGKALRDGETMRLVYVCEQHTHAYIIVLNVMVSSACRIARNEHISTM